MTEHTVKSYDEELAHLTNIIARMGGMAEAQFAAALQALGKRDSDLAARVVAGDARVDELEHEVQSFAVRLLALRQRQLLDALATRGHAAQQAIRLESPQEQAWKAGKLPKPLSAARAHPEWSSLNGKVRGEEDRQQLIDELAKRT